MEHVVMIQYITNLTKRWFYFCGFRWPIHQNCHVLLEIRLLALSIVTRIVNAETITVINVWVDSGWGTVIPEIIQGVTFYMRVLSLFLYIVTCNLNMKYKEIFIGGTMPSRHPIRFMHVPHNLLCGRGTSWTRDLVGAYRWGWGENFFDKAPKRNILDDFTCFEPSIVQICSRVFAPGMCTKKEILQKVTERLYFTYLRGIPQPTKFNQNWHMSRGRRRNQVW